MRKINRIVIHCSATLENKPFNAAAIDAMHKERGFKKIGYHYVVLLDGTIQKGRDESEIGAHAQGYNANSIGICYIGGIGVDKLTGRLGAKDTRTQMQKDALQNLVRQVRLKYPTAQVMGHRDLSPDLNKDGVITSEEFIKECPCFDAMSEYTGTNSDTAKGGNLRTVSKVLSQSIMDPARPGRTIAEAGAEELSKA